MIDSLKKQLHALPYTPGVYLMKNHQGTIIYIGKAKKLHERVNSYFGHNKNHSRKTRRLIQQIATFSTIEVDTELDAFLLECQLIQTHRPLYNHQLNSFDNYRYLKLSILNDTVSLTLLSQPKGDNCFGPFSTPRRLVKIKKILEELYGLPSHAHWFHSFSLKPKPAFSKELIFAELREALTQDGKQPLERLKKQMLYASENFAFERALLLKNDWQMMRYFLKQNYRLNNAKQTAWQLLVLPFQKKIKYYLLFQGLVVANRTITKQTFKKYTLQQLAQKIKPAHPPMFHTYFEKTDVDFIHILTRYLKQHEECTLHELPTSFYTNKKS